MGGNAAFTVHAVCYIAHAFRAAMKLAVRCCQGRAEGGGRKDGGPRHPMGSSKEGNYIKYISIKSCNQTLLLIGY